MADKRDPGKDRENDKDINTKIDAEEADDIFTKDPWTTDDAVYDDDASSHRPTRLGRKWITEAIHGVASGMSGALNEELERRAPNLSVVKTELTDTWDDIKELREDLAKQLQPFTRSIENITRRILPRVKRAMPESWYKKMESTLQRRADERAAASGGSYSKEEEQASTIRSELEAVFAQQQEHTLEVEHKKELDQKKDQMIERGLAATRHKADMRVYTRIYDAVRGTELFHRTLHTAYMKKSLEVQYKHFFVAQDTYNLLSKSFSAFEEYMRGVVKNTGLPDSAKANASDYLKELRTQRYGMQLSEYLTNARKMIFKKIKNVASDTLSGVGMAASMAEMAPDMADAYLQEHGGTGGVGARLAGWILGRTKGSVLVRAGLDKIAPWVTALNGRAANFKDRLYLGIDKLQRQWSNDTNPFKQLIAQFLPNVSGITGAPNDLLRDPGKPAVYDKVTRQTIVEIIPGYLRHILHEVAMFRTGRDDLPMLTYNQYRRIFTSTDQFRKDVMNDQAMADSPETQAYRVNSLIQVIAKGSMSKNPNGPKDGGATAHAKTISKIMANHAVYSKPFDPNRLFEYVNNHKIDSYIEAIMSDIEPREFDETIRVILDGITNKDGTLNKMLAGAVGDSINQMRMADQYKVQLPKVFEDFGGRDILSETAGEVYIDKNGVKRVFRNAQRGIVKDATGEISKSVLSDRLADIDEAKLTDPEDIASSYGYEELERHLKADEFVKTQTTAWKTSFENSAPGKAMVWLAAKLGRLFDPKNSGKLPSLMRTLAGNAAKSMSKEKLSDTEKRIRKLAKNSKIRGKEAEESSADTIVNVVEKESKGTKPKVKGARVIPKRRKSSKQQEPELAEETATEEDTPKKTTKKSSRKKTVVAAASINISDNADISDSGYELPPKQESVGSKVKQWFEEKYKSLDASLDKIPQTPEDVEKQVASVIEFMDTAWKKRPKSAKDIQDKFESYLKHVSESHPELAQYAIDRANEIAQTRGYKFVTAWTKYLNDKVGKKATKWIKDGYASVSKQAKEAKDKLQSKASELVNNIIKASGSTMDAGIAFTAINPFAKKEDREAARQLIESEDPNLLKNLEAHFKKEASNLYGTAKEKLSSAMNSTGGFIKDATKTAGNWWSQLKSKWYEGMGVEEAPSRESAGEVDSNLMTLLSEWRDSQTSAHATLIDAVSAIVDKMGEGGGGQSFDRNRYGFFGQATRTGKGILRKGAKGMAKGAWWLIKTGAKAYTHAALFPIQAPWYALKGIAKVGSWAANGVGINPFRDIYVLGEDKPILTWRKQASKEGVYFEGTNIRPKSTKEIIEKGVPIVDHEGQYLISEEDIKKGLWAKDSSVLHGTGKLLGGIIKAPFGVATAYLKMKTEVIKGMFGIGKIVAKGIFGAGAPEKYVDVYRKGEFDKPILTRRKQKDGVYLKDKDGNFSRLERSSDIHEPVYEIIDGNPQEVINADDLEHGLCDVNGKPLGSGQYRGGLLGAALGLGAGLGKLGLKVLGGGAGMFFSFWKNTFGLLGKAGGAVVSGIRHLGARLFGLDSKTGHGAIAFKGVTDRLDAIIEILKSGIVTSGEEAQAGKSNKKKKKTKSGATTGEESTTKSESEKTSEKTEKKEVHGSAPASGKVGGTTGGEGGKKSSIRDKINWGFNSDDDESGWVSTAATAAGTYVASKVPFVQKAWTAIKHPVNTYKQWRAGRAAANLLKSSNLPEMLIKEGVGVYRNPATGKIVPRATGEAAEAGGKVLFRKGDKLVDAAGKVVKSTYLEKLGVKSSSALYKATKSVEEAASVASKVKNATAGLEKTTKLGKLAKVGKVVKGGLGALGVALSAVDSYSMNKRLDTGALHLGVANEEESAAIRKLIKGEDLTDEDKKLIESARSKLTEEQKKMLVAEESYNNNNIVGWITDGDKTVKERLADLEDRNRYLSEHGDNSYKKFDKALLGLSEWDPTAENAEAYDALKIQGDHAFYDPRSWWNGIVTGAQAFGTLSGHIARGMALNSVQLAKDAKAGWTVMMNHAKDNIKKYAAETHKVQLDAVELAKLRAARSSDLTRIMKESGIALPAEYYNSESRALTADSYDSFYHGSSHGAGNAARLYQVKGDINTARLAKTYSDFLKRQGKTISDNVPLEKQIQDDKEFLTYLKSTVALTPDASKKTKPEWMGVDVLKWYPTKSRRGAPYAVVDLNAPELKVHKEALRRGADSRREVAQKAQLIRNGAAWPDRSEYIRKLKDNIACMFGPVRDAQRPNLPKKYTWRAVECFSMYIDGFEDVRQFYILTLLDGPRVNPKVGKATSLELETKVIREGWLFDDTEDVLKAGNSVFGQWFVQWVQVFESTGIEEHWITRKQGDIMYPNERRNLGKYVMAALVDYAKNAIGGMIKEVEKKTKDGSLNTYMSNDELTNKINALADEIIQNGNLSLSNADDASKIENKVLAKLYQGGEYLMTSDNDIDQLKRRYAAAVNQVLSSRSGSALEKKYTGEIPDIQTAATVGPTIEKAAERSAELTNEAISRSINTFSSKFLTDMNAGVSDKLTGVDKSLITKPTPSKGDVTPAKVEESKMAAATAQQTATAKAISTAVGPTIEAAKRMDNNKALTSELASITNLQSKSFELLGSIIGPNGLRVEGIPELTAITAAKPNGGNVTNITNVMPTQTQNEGLDVRAAQR